MDFYDVGSQVLAVAGLVGCTWFVVDYHIRTGGTWNKLGSWIKHDAGRFMMADRTILASLLVTILAARIFGDYPGRRLVSFSLFVVYMAFAWWPLRLLYRAPGVQAKERDD